MYVDVAGFEAVLREVHRQLEANNARLLVTSGQFSQPVRVTFAGATPEGVSSEALDDLNDTLAALTANVSVDRFIEIRGDPTRFNDDGAETDAPDAARRKYELALEVFDVDDLRVRRWLKRTSKNLELQAVEWEVAIKGVDDDLPTPQGAPIPFATMLLTATTTGNPFAPPAEVVISLDTEDVKTLLDTLGRLNTALEALAGAADAVE